MKRRRTGWGSRSVRRLLRKLDFAGTPWPHKVEDTRILRLSGGAARWRLEARDPRGWTPWVGSDDRVSDCLRGMKVTPGRKNPGGYPDCDIVADDISQGATG